MVNWKVVIWKSREVVMKDVKWRQYWNFKCWKYYNKSKLFIFVTSIFMLLYWKTHYLENMKVVVEDSYVSLFTVQKMKFSFKDFSSKCEGNRGFGHIYWKNPKWKTSLFVQCLFPPIPRVKQPLLRDPGAV